MSFARCFGFAAVACQRSAAPAGAALIMHKDMSYDVARALAEDPSRPARPRVMRRPLSSSIATVKDSLDARRQCHAAHDGECAAQGLRR